MKTYLTYFSKPALFVTALFVTMFAFGQRGDRGGGGRGGGFGGGGGSVHQPSFGGGNPGRSFEQPRNNGGFQPRDNSTPRNNNFPGNTGTPRDNRFPRDNSSPRSNDVRPRDNTPIAGNTDRPQRYFDNQPNRNNQPGNSGFHNNVPDQRDRLDRGNNRFGNDRNNNRYYGGNSDRYRNYNGYGYNNNRYYGRNYYPSPYRFTYNYPYWGQRYTSLSFSYNVIPFGGIGYCYNNGIYYRPFGGYYQVVAPPIGLSISVLPFGYSRVYVGSYPYYYYGGIYYQQYNNSYQVVDPPLGAKLPALPNNAREVLINGDRYFEDNGTYYMEEYNINNQRLYTVVGVHGKLDENTVDQVLHGTASNNNISTEKDQVIYTTLPDNCTKVAIDGHEYFRSPTDDYYEAITDGDHTGYRIVSKK
jgi:hypothetical protein